MTFSDDMAEGMERLEKRKAMRACEWWDKLRQGGVFRHLQSGAVYMKAATPAGPDCVFDMNRGTYRWAPDVIDFSPEAAGQYQLGRLEFVPR